MIRSLSASISQTWISLQIQNHHWVVPTFQSIHILAIAALIFASFSANLAILRSPHGAPSTPWLAGSYQWTWAALAILLVSGTILVTGEPTRSLMNIYFRTKVVLIIVAAAFTIVMQRSLTGGSERVRSGGVLSWLAGLSIVAWIAILFCGRFVAYFGDLAGAGS